MNEIRWIEIFSKSKSQRIELNNPDLVIERESLLKLLANKAETSGAKIRLNHQFIGFSRRGKKVNLIFKNLKTKEEWNKNADVLVGADGVFSSVAQCVYSNNHHLTSLIQAKVYLPNGLDPHSCQIWFNSNRIRYFYWLIPESNRSGVIGLIGDNEKEAEAFLKEILEARGLELLEYQRAWVPLHRLGGLGKNKIQDGNVFLVGDAAAQVKNTTVGGVVSGLYGAKALAHALLNGRDYHSELSELKRELDLHFMVRKILNHFNCEDYDKLIDLTNGRLKEIIKEWTRDELRKSFLRMIWAEPRLVPLGVKTLLRSLFQGKT